MTNCPNCGYPITDEDNVCPNCGFNLKKYREDYFTDRHKSAKREDQNTDSQMMRRATYRSEFKPTKQNSTVASMIEWIRANVTIVFVLGVFLLILMSFSRALGWISFFILIIQLFIVCERSKKITQYTVDKRLTEKMNQIGSNVVNHVEAGTSRVGERISSKDRKLPEIKIPKTHTMIQMLVVLTALISLVVFFTSSGNGISISQVILQMAREELGTNTAWFAAILYLIWLFLTAIPIVIVIATFRTGKFHKLVAFITSFLETGLLIYAIFRVNDVIGNTTISQAGQLANQVINSAALVGASFYMLILASLMTTGLSLYNLIKSK